MLFPNLREFKPIGCSDVNPDFYTDYPYQSTQDYLPNSFTNSTTTTTNNFAIDSTSSSDRGVTGSPSDQRLPKKQGYSYDSSFYNNTQPSLAKPADESKFRDPEYLNPLDNIEHSLPKKKVKTEQVFNLDTFEEEFKKSAQFPWNIFDNIDDGLIDKYSSDQWLQPADSEADLSSILKPKEPVENIPENKETSQIEESKCEDIVDRNYFVQIDFGSGIETPKQAESPIQQADSSEGLSRNLQILKNCLSGVTELDYQRLDPEVYLNDNLINFYMKFIENGLLTEERRKKCHFFNTYFMAQMRKLFSAVDDDFSRFDSVYEKMGKWTKKTNIFEKDFLFIPINENEHWNLLILCNPSDLFSNNDNFPFIIFLDSLSRMDNVYSGMLFHYFYRELRSKMPEKFMALHTKVCKFSYSMFPYFQQMVPKQSNLTDCGLYLLQYIEMFAEDETPIIQGKEDNNKRRWFPRKLIQEKRNHMKKIIESLNNNQFEIIEEYRMERDQIIKDCLKRNDEYDTFNPKEFWQAVTRTYGNTVLTDQEKLCLMLDFYYFGTLDFNQTT